MEQPREYKHLGNPLGKESGGEYSSNWGFSRQRTKAYKFRPLFNTSKKGNKNLQGKGRKTQKYRTPPSSDRQIYGKFPAKIFNTLFRKSTGSQETRQQMICQNMRETYMVRETCACITFWKNAEIQNFHSIIHRQNNWIHNMQPIYAH